MPILIQKTQLAAKIEAVEGTAETPGAADALLISNSEFSPRVEINKRGLVGADLSPYKSLSGRRSAGLRFEVELKGSGTPGVAPQWGKLLAACGFAETITPSTKVTYTPTSSSIPSVTLALYLDGLLTKLWGARGNVSLNFAGGQAGSLKFDFTGADFSVADIPLLSGVSYDSTQPGIFVNAGFTVDNYAALIEKLQLDMANIVKLRSDINRESGYRSAIITGRRPAGSLDPELPFVAEYDIFYKWRSGSEGALYLSIGETAGNIVSVSAPKCRYTRLGMSNQSGQSRLAANFELNRNAGNDELKIELT